MKSTFKMESPGKMECTLTMTMELATWKELNNQLADKYPSWQLSNVISKLLAEATKTFYEHGEVID